MNNMLYNISIRELLQKYPFTLGYFEENRLDVKDLKAIPL